MKDITKPTIVREFLQEGSYIKSRRINEFVYIITNKYIYIYTGITNKELYIPATKDSLSGNKWELLPADSVSILPNPYDDSFLVLSGMNTLDLNSTVQMKVVKPIGSIDVPGFDFNSQGYPQTVGGVSK